MSKPFMFEKPLGMRDTLPAMYEMKKQVREQLEAEMSGWGYQMIETPTLEYYETVGVASAILDQQLFKLLDQQGNTLVLRPDMTAPIARLVASSLKGESYPLRLSYQSNVYRAQQHEGGKPAEFEQIGVELIGDGTVSADGEVIALMVAALKRAGLSDFKVAIGHIGYVNALLLDIVGNAERADALRRFLYEKNYVGFREHVKNLPLSSIDQRRLLGLLKLRGGKDTLVAAAELVQTEQGTAALAELEELWSVLESYGIEDYVKLDLNLVLHMSYYTGAVFEGYGNNLGVPLCSGGRYDELLDKFKRPGQATGFGVRLDLLLEALGETAEKRKQTCIIFSKERRAEAFQQAASLREAGLAVVLQDIAGVADVDSMSEQFSDVLYYIGKVKKGEA
ncbi:ATP phosphoribosyltransferase regulatory subunit [Halalkalibacter nanhaiisediminis]|uniref:ATP phosphoribosyltransferase regulatory subunit n=1 Tax=Halalkalibacter nanhaiisediminis TaxID=688079 RepID=A0A562QTB5_9BACI|nr:ATP phosphoribosyltransferase regulatory subunit [Halalkalibacter nanhaiisediminis]TWI60002.1 ATP phosphoribosyltransferase regulatory subunit [Halalkalibacter nanhaiisediminis]